ncbi:histidine kinase [Flavobacterium difficile]|uniref:Pr2TM family membrane protein n=1 Tax=Flavobacterium difficile TaxID=2709659 RepID=A0ABX0I3P0_9FLAO|nr:histidine kinase [Flavobacterium difficile]NHM01346.1 Pr2TM family membrane protein [Flavobacterium difficile]
MIKNKYIREFPRAIVIGFSVFSVIVLINFLNGDDVSFDHKLKLTLLYTLLYSVSLHLANTTLFIFLDGFFKEERFSKKRIFIGFISSFFLSTLVIFLLRVFENVLIEGKTLSEFLAKETPSNYIVSSIFTFIILLIVHFIYLYKWYQENKLKEQKIIAGSASAQFESLKNQIDPHFLFNSLNVLSSLIEENPDAAQKFTTSLSKVYRYVLEQKDKELVSVEEELKFAKTYMNLLKMRFENSITFELPEFENDEAKVVPLSLQLLLENCIKHNIVSEKKPLHIKIYIDKNELIIENNKQIKEVLQDRKGVGLQNIVSRYAILTKRKVIIQESETIFKVKLPILTKQIISMETKVIASENMSYIRAKERVEKLKGFYGNLISYCTVIPILILINMNTSNFQWFWFPMLGWGFGLTMHAIETFGYGKAWEEKKIREILNKEKQDNKNWN